jgi:ABC-type lipoprotein release transport system permease subunit
MSTEAVILLLVLLLIFLSMIMLTVMCCKMSSVEWELRRLVTSAPPRMPMPVPTAPPAYDYYYP